MENDFLKSEWNGANLTNIRIHEIQEELKMCALNDDTMRWIILLERYNHHIYGWEKDDEKTEIQNELKSLAEKINKYHFIQKKLKKFNKSNRGTPSEIVDELNKLEYKIDAIFHRSGLQSPISEDAGDAF